MQIPDTILKKELMVPPNIRNIVEKILDVYGDASKLAIMITKCPEKQVDEVMMASETIVHVDELIATLELNKELEGIPEILEMIKKTRNNMYETIITAKDYIKYVTDLMDETKHLILILLYNAYKTPLE